MTSGAAAAGRGFSTRTPRHKDTKKSFCTEIIEGTERSIQTEKRYGSD